MLCGPLRLTASVHRGLQQWTCALSYCLGRRPPSHGLLGRSSFNRSQKVQESVCKPLFCLPHACALRVSHCNPFGTEKNYKQKERVHSRHFTHPTVHLSPAHRLSHAYQKQKSKTMLRQAARHGPPPKAWKRSVPWRITPWDSLSALS